MSSQPLRVAVIGLGDVAVAHLEGYRPVAEVTVVAGADLRADRARALADRYGFTPYTDYREMLRQERPDIACVLTTVNSHREVVETVADHGIHVLCEKPLAVRLEDADAMIQRCAERGVALFYAASYRFLPPLVAARELIAAGAIGRVQLLTETLIGGQGIESYQPMGLAHYPAGGPGGAGWGLVDHGIHLVDAFGWMMSSPVEAVYGVGQISGESPVPEYAVLEYRNGAIGHLIYHSGTYGAELPSEGIFSEAPDWADLVASEPGRAEGGRWQEQPGTIRVYGTHGALRIYHYANRLFLRNAAGLREITVPNHPLPAQFGAELASLVGTIRRGEEPVVTGQVGREALRAVLGVYRSMALRQRIVLT